MEKAITLVNPNPNPDHGACPCLVHDEAIASTMGRSLTHTMVNRGVFHEFIHEVCINDAICRSVGCPWDAQGRAMVRAWVSSGMCVGCLCGVSVDRPWVVLGPSWVVRGLSVGCPSVAAGEYVEPSSVTRGIYMGCPWITRVTPTERTSVTRGAPMRCAWVAYELLVSRL